MLMMACERLRLDGLLFAPAHYHVAAQARGLLRFLDPQDEAFFVALGQLTKPLPLKDATALVARGGIVDANTGETVSWRAARMVFAVSERMKTVMDHPDYERRVQEATKGMSLRVGADER